MLASAALASRAILADSRALALAFCLASAASSAVLASAALASASFASLPASSATSSARRRPVAPGCNASMRRSIDASNASMRAVSGSGAGSVWALIPYGRWFRMSKWSTSPRAVSAARAASVWALIPYGRWFRMSNGSTSPSLRRVSSSSSKEQTRDDDNDRSPPVRASTLKLSYLPRGAGRVCESRVVAGGGEF